MKGLNIGKDFMELVSHSKNYVLAQFFTMGLAFLTLPIFTRLMSPADYGVLSVFTSFEGIISIIFGMGLRGAVSRYYYEDKGDFFAYLSSSFWLILISSISFFVFAFLLRYLIQSFLNIPSGMIWLAFGIALPQALYQLFQSYFQAAKRSRLVALLNMAGAILGTGLAIMIMLQLDSERYYAKAIGQGVGATSVFILALCLLKKKLVFSFKKTHLAYSIVFGLPVVIHLLSQNLLNTFDQIVINQIVGQYATGIYSVAYKIGMVQSIISMGILNAWTPMFYDKLNRGKYDEIESLAKKYALVVMLVAVFLIFFAREFIILLADRSYHEALSIIPIIIVSYFFFFLYTMYVNYAFYAKKTQGIALITIFTGSINVFLNYLFIPRYGYIAAAWTTLFSYIGLFFLHYVNVRWVLKVKNITNLQVFFFPTIILIFHGIFNHFFFAQFSHYLSSLILRVFVFVLTIGLAYFLIKRKSSSNEDIEVS